MTACHTARELLAAGPRPQVRRGSATTTGNGSDTCRQCFPNWKASVWSNARTTAHAYLVLRYANGVEVPSWMTSDGTLKLLALTLLAYLPVADSYPSDRRFLHEIILVEEPEDGVHPLALDAIYDSLASVYGGQVLVTTHSPTLLGLARPEEALCFARAADGANRHRPGNYEETQVIPECNEQAVHEAVRGAVEQGVVWLTNGPASVRKEQIPYGVLDDDAVLHPRPDPIATQELAANAL